MKKFVTYFLMCVLILNMSITSLATEAQDYNADYVYEEPDIIIGGSDLDKVHESWNQATFYVGEHVKARAGFLYDQDKCIVTLS